MLVKDHQETANYELASYLVFSVLVAAATILKTTTNSKAHHPFRQGNSRLVANMFFVHELVLKERAGECTTACPHILALLNKVGCLLI